MLGSQRKLVEERKIREEKDPIQDRKSIQKIKAQKKNEKKVSPTPNHTLNISIDRD